jgi:hypothetical protein
MGNFVTFELTDAEVEALRSLGWGKGRSDLICQAIIRDYIRRHEMKARRHARRRGNPAPLGADQRARDSGL